MREVGGVDVLEELLDEVDVREDHAAAAVAAEFELVDGVAGGVSMCGCGCGMRGGREGW